MKKEKLIIAVAFMVIGAVIGLLVCDFDMREDPPHKTSSAQQAFEPVAAEPALTASPAMLTSRKAPISRPLVSDEDRIDQEYAERLYDVRFAIAARHEGYWPPFPSEPIEALEDRRDALIAELVAKKAEVRKKRLGEKPVAAEAEPKR